MWLRITSHWWKACSRAVLRGVGVVGRVVHAFHREVRWLGDGSGGDARMEWEGGGSCACGAAFVLPDVFETVCLWAGFCGWLVRDEGGLPVRESCANAVVLTCAKLDV